MLPFKIRKVVISVDDTECNGFLCDLCVNEAECMRNEQIPKTEPIQPLQEGSWREMHHEETTLKQKSC